MSRILVGPMVRFVDERSATILVELDGPAEVTVLDHTAATFTVSGHHYALVPVRGLEPGRTYRYDVRVDPSASEPDGDVVDPDRGPAASFRTLSADDAITIALGSCHLSGPRRWRIPFDRVVRRFDPSLDALTAYAERLMDADEADRPDLLLLLGDQVYADDPPEETLRFIRERRADGPLDVAVDFEEHAHLYRTAWSEPALRWLLANVPSAMVFDDHEVGDDWMLSRDWVDDARASSRWEDRLAGSLMSYWVYQYLGDLSPDELERDELYRAVRGEADGAEVLRRTLLDEHRDRGGSRWLFGRDLGHVRLLVLDARAGRALGDGRRDMIAEQWDELADALHADRHLIVGSSVPVLYPEGFHHVQAWSERVAAGAWGSLATRATERLRRALSLSGWPAFAASFDRLMGLIREAADRRPEKRPRSVTIVSGDVHHGYVARLRAIRHRTMAIPVHQVVCSPFRNPLAPHERFAHLLAASRVGARVTSVLARLAGVDTTDVTWRRLEGPEFSDQIATLRIVGDDIDLTTEVTRHGPTGRQRLEPAWRRRLAPPRAIGQPSPDGGSVGESEAGSTSSR